MGKDLIDKDNADFCDACAHPRRCDDRFCAACGRPLNQNLSERQDAVLATVGSTSQRLERRASSVPSEQMPPLFIAISPTFAPVLNNRWVVLMLLAVVGPLGLPALWLSPRFKPWVKATITLVWFLLTAVVPLAIAWYWLDYALRPLVDGF